LADKLGQEARIREITPTVTLVTTWDVPFSDRISRFAIDQGMEYYHWFAMFKIVDGEYKFNFRIFSRFTNVKMAK
jgi:hypothetical protein